MKFILSTVFILIISSCAREKKVERRLEKTVKHFAGHLYIHYHKYNKRKRTDNTGKFKDTWPLSPNAHDPHDKPGVKPMKMD